MSGCGEDGCASCSSRTFTAYVESSDSSSPSCSESSGSRRSRHSSSSYSDTGCIRPLPILTSSRVTSRNVSHTQKIISRYQADSPVLGTLSIEPIPGSPINSVPITMSASASGVINIQWPTFSGTCSTSGRGYITFGQPMTHLPAYTIIQPISLNFKGTYRVGMFVVDRTGDILYGGSAGLKIFFFEDLSGSNVNTGDAFTISGSCIQWISGEC